MAYWIVKGFVGSMSRRGWTWMRRLIVRIARSIDEDVAFGSGWGVRVLPRDPKQERRKVKRPASRRRL
jgi:hypothetical protein